MASVQLITYCLALLLLCPGEYLLLTYLPIYYPHLDFYSRSHAHSGKDNSNVRANHVLVAERNTRTQAGIAQVAECVCRDSANRGGGGGGGDAPVYHGVIADRNSFATVFLCLAMTPCLVCVPSTTFHLNPP